MVLEKTLEHPLDCKEIQPVNPNGNQSWIFIGRTHVEAETPILWPPDVKSWLIGKDPDARKDWRQEEKGKTEDEMVRYSLTQRTWVWVSSGSWRWTGRPGVLWSMGSERVRHDWETELNWAELTFLVPLLILHLRQVLHYFHPSFGSIQSLQPHKWLENFFWKGSDSKYFSLCGPRVFCHNYSILQF